MRLSRYLSFSLLAMVSAPATAHAGLAVHAPHGITVTADSGIAARYPRTQCLNFEKERRRLGFICSSSSPRFVADFGISTTPAAPDAPQEYRVATGMSSYEMKPTAINGRTLFTAEVDCDNGDAAQYRATSTCHIAFMPLADARFYYSSFLLRNEVTSTSGIDPATVLRLYTQLTPDPPAPRYPDKHILKAAGD
ncbi:TPA: hypothetical protein ACXNP2_003021 [Stenotrophomonas maltophilia]